MITCMHDDPVPNTIWVVNVIRTPNKAMKFSPLSVMTVQLMIPCMYHYACALYVHDSSLTWCVHHYM